MKNFDQTQAIIDYEAGVLNFEETVELFQELVDSGLAWKLQGHYGRTARELIDLDYIAVNSTK